MVEVIIIWHCSNWISFQRASSGKLKLSVNVPSWGGGFRLSAAQEGGELWARAAGLQLCDLKPSKFLGSAKGKNGKALKGFREALLTPLVESNKASLDKL